MPKSKTTVQIRPDSATPGIRGDHAHLIEQLQTFAPKPLNSFCVADGDEIAERGTLIEHSFMAFERYVFALLTDTRDHNWAVEPDRKYLEACFHDLRVQVAGTLFRAAETVREVRDAA